ncbi:MAG: T9SS type B sorting domain-containing protein [Bacteroidia bacterium]|nr:T9SS type B sorting domain-containing protein [Bacteroidia bacterium]
MNHFSTPLFIPLLILFALGLNLNAQKNNTRSILDLQSRYIFTIDSLEGFDENAAASAALSEGYYGDEFKVRMYHYKRAYINSKYKLKSKVHINNFLGITNSRAASCINEDFESSMPAIITTSNQIAGWTVTSGNNGLPNNACSIGGCCPNQPVDCELIQCPTSGYLDPSIGTCYPIFSVFGNSNNNGNTFNPNLPQMKGTNIIRINNNFPQSSIARLSKTINVTASSALFQFAYISVLSPGHPCCGSTAFFIKLTNLTTNSILACPSASIFSPAPGCNSVSPSTQYYLAGGACGVNPANNNNQSIFNKWSLGSLDLTPYTGNNINIEITVTDCATGAHFGYAYFDSQCSPMDITGNNTLYPISSPSIVLTSCSPSSNTIIAPPSVGPYTWTSTAISIPPNLSTPSHTNTTLISNQSGTVALIMSPPGICSPIIKVITLSVTNAPVANIQVTQPSCTNSVATVSLTINSSNTISPSIIWNPPGTISSNSLTNSNPPPGSGSVTIEDVFGCTLSLSYSINTSPISPIINSLNVNPTKCDTASGMISLNVFPINTMFSWSPPVSNTYSASQIPEGVYSITLTNQTCTTYTQITIQAINKATIINVSNTLSNCNAATGGATITALNSNNIYVWTPPVSTSSIISNVPAGNYTVNINQGGCGTTSIITILNPEGPQKIETLKKDNICKKNTGSISILGIDGGTPPYLFSFNNTNYSTTDSFHNLAAGNYYIYIKDANGCIYMHKETVKDLDSKIEIHYKINTTGNCEETYSVLIDSIVGGVPPYYLSVNGSPLFYAQSINDLTESEYVINVYDANNCITPNYIVNKTIKSKPLIYIPNSFTPNNDGLNDFWIPFIDCVVEYKCLIFDRWGILIKQMNNMEEFWDGIFKGKELPVGVYSYIIDIIEFSSKAKRLTGHINLIK